jgi:hypothetical protein
LSFSKIALNALKINFVFRWYIRLVDVSKTAYKSKQAQDKGGILQLQASIQNNVKLSRNKRKQSITNKF